MRRDIPLEVSYAIPIVVIVVSVLIAGGIDVWSFRIPNWLTMPLIASGLLYHSFVSETLGFGGSVCGLLVGTLPYLWLCWKGGMGAGDLKLMAGVGAWLGPWMTLHVLIVSGIATGCYSLGILLLKACTGGRSALKANQFENSTESQFSESQIHPLHSELSIVLSREDRRYHAVPFGAMVAFGVIVVVIWIV